VTFRDWQPAKPPMPPPAGPWLRRYVGPVHYADTWEVASGPWLLRMADRPRPTLRTVRTGTARPAAPRRRTS